MSSLSTALIVTPGRRLPALCFHVVLMLLRWLSRGLEDRDRQRLREVIVQGEQHLGVQGCVADLVHVERAAAPVRGLGRLVEHDAELALADHGEAVAAESVHATQTPRRHQRIDHAFELEAGGGKDAALECR